MIWRFLCLLSLLGVAACSTIPVVPLTAAPLAAQVVDQPFDVSGSLGVKLNGKGHSARFDWLHTPERDELAIRTPLGNTVASLLRDRDGVSLQADGQTQYASDVETLTERQLGWSLPLANLVWWLRGHPAPQLPYSLTENGDLEQQGWVIRFQRDAANVQQPRRIDLSRDGLSIRLVLSDWRQFIPLASDPPAP